MDSFKTQQEIWEYLIAGKAVTHAECKTEKSKRIHGLCIKNGRLQYLSGAKAYYAFSAPENWVKYTPPDSIKKLEVLQDKEEIAKLLGTSSP